MEIVNEEFTGNDTVGKTRVAVGARTLRVAEMR